MTEPERPEVLERIVALTRDLVLIPGTETRREDLSRCIQFVRNHLERLPGIVVRPYDIDGLPSLVASPPDHPHPEVLLCAHLDVINHPPDEAYRSTLRDGRIYGPGAGDMKGALAIVLEVFRTLQDESPGASLGLAITSDEETGGERGVGALVRDHGLRCGVAMIPDGGSLNEVTIEEKGILHLHLDAHGHAAHAARPWLGDNPLERMLERLGALREWFAELEHDGDRWYPTCAVTYVSTENRSINRTPSDAQAWLDIRFPPPYTAAELLARVEATLGPEIAVEPVISAAPTHLAPDPEYLRITETVTGSPVCTVRDDGGSDARFLCEERIPVLMSRPRVGNLHAEDEWIDIASMHQFYRIYMTYIRQRLGIGPVG